MSVLRVALFRHPLELRAWDNRGVNNPINREEILRRNPLHRKASGGTVAIFAGPRYREIPAFAAAYSQGNPNVRTQERRAEKTPPRECGNTHRGDSLNPLKSRE